MSIVAVVSVFTGCVKQHNEEVEKATISSHYSGDDCINKIKNDEKINNSDQTYTLYEYEKKSILAETSLTGGIGDVIKLPVNAKFAADSISAMNGKYDSTINGFENGTAVLCGFAYIDADEELKTTWKKGVEEQDLNVSYNDNGYEQIAYALSDPGSNTVKAWMSCPHGMYLVQDQVFVSTEPEAPSGYEFKDSYKVTGNYNDELGLHPEGKPYILSKN